MIIVQVYENRTGRPAEGIKVCLQFHSFSHMGFTKDQRTDSDGRAYFDYDLEERCSFYVDGSCVDERVYPKTINTYTI